MQYADKLWNQISPESQAFSDIQALTRPLHWTKYNVIAVNIWHAIY